MGALLAATSSYELDRLCAWMLGLEEKELLELRENYQRRAAERYPIAPQLSYGNGDGMPERPDGAFLI